MHSRLMVVSLCVLATAGCQTLGGHHPGTATPAPATSSSTAATAPAAPSPWQIAREHGMAFRAVGNEPGWDVEVQKSHTPTLFVNLDYGTHQLKVPNAAVTSDPKTATITFRGAATDGTPVQLKVVRGQCEDNMSGHQMEAAAELDVGARQYKGCGRFLLQH
ncbi:MAG TPA: hypothetical protein VF271_06500 [Rhodanobacteraceae bacterium]